MMLFLKEDVAHDYWVLILKSQFIGWLAGIITFCVLFWLYDRWDRHRRP